MAKTIKQAIIDEIHFPLPEGFVDNKIAARGMDGDAPFNALVANGNDYKGCVADCLYSLVVTNGFAEADKSISVNQSGIIARANELYSAIGEPKVGVAKVIIGD